MANKEIVIHLNEGLEEDTVLGFVLLNTGGTHKDLRDEIDCDKLLSSDFVFLGGSKMLPIGASQEERWEVKVEDVTIRAKAESNPCKPPRVDSMGSCNDSPPLCSSNDPHIHDQMPNISGDDIAICEDVTITSHKMLKSILATPKEVKKWERDVKAAKEKLQAMEHHDRFELMSKDKDGKAMFQIWCVECESSYGQGGHDTISNFIHSHINSMAHQRHIAVCKKRKQEHDNKKVECSKADLISTNKEKVD
ncbi:hypothetical protein L7F22_021336 [Adiantum nelumboides]|nr:hypothetical protein [Adiantum nelumboides]